MKNISIFSPLFILLFVHSSQAAQTVLTLSCQGTVSIQGQKAANIDNVVASINLQNGDVEISALPRLHLSDVSDTTYEFTGEGIGNDENIVVHGGINRLTGATTAVAMVKGTSRMQLFYILSCLPQRPLF